jgi:L-lactate dehydrogenase complex protein LldG
MSSARETILGRARSAIAGTATASPAPRSYRRQGERGASGRVDLFCKRIGDYRAEVKCLDADGLQAAIAEQFALRGARRVGVPVGIPPAWRPRTLELVEDVELSPAELDGLDGVLTGCTLAIAETGTIVLAAGPAEGRRALTLVPDLHVCVVASEQIVELVPEAMALLAERVRRGRSPLTFISGPSATSDIELSRVEGVHGPRQLVALVIQESP